MTCTASYHTWAWGSSTTCSKTPRHLYCMCGRFTRGEYDDLVGRIAADRDAAQTRLAEVEAEMQRLREALEVIERKADVARLGLDRYGPQHARITEAREIARAALATAGAVTPPAR